MPSYCPVPPPPSSADHYAERGLELPDAAMKELQKEAAVMARMRHPNIVTLMGICALPPCIVTGGPAQGTGRAEHSLRSMHSVLCTACRA